MSEDLKHRIMQYVVLMAGFLMLLSIIIPHHHHRDGMPCYQSLTAEQAQGDDSADTHECGCDGHNLAYFDVHNSLQYATNGDAHLLLMPLLVLFQFNDLPGSAFRGQSLDHAQPWYIESLCDAWIAEACGLRAPPMS